MFCSLPLAYGVKMYAVDFRKPICIVTESKEFHQAIRDIGETLQE
ncbi:hypothetical protein AAAU98_03360 [Enterocloster citroniae]